MSSPSSAASLARKAEMWSPHTPRDSDVAHPSRLWDRCTWQHLPYKQPRCRPPCAHPQSQRVLLGDGPRSRGQDVLCYSGSNLRAPFTVGGGCTAPRMPRISRCPGIPTHEALGLPSAPQTTLESMFAHTPHTRPRRTVHHAQYGVSSQRECEKMLWICVLYTRGFISGSVSHIVLCICLGTNSLK